MKIIFKTSRGKNFYLDIDNQTKTKDIINALSSKLSEDGSLLTTLRINYYTINITEENINSNFIALCNLNKINLFEYTEIIVPNGNNKKPAQYKKKTDDTNSNSEYESDGGTLYTVDKNIIGAGTSAYARKVVSTKDQNKEKIVLSPIHTNMADIKESRTKNIFNQHVNNTSELYEYYDGDYRMVLDKAPGIPYYSLQQKDLDCPYKQLCIFYSALQALKNAHAKGFIVIDLKRDNIYYEKFPKPSYLIDGGTSAQVGSELPGLFSRKVRGKTVDERRTIWMKDFKYYAPECFLSDDTKANEKIDIYSLGHMMEAVITEQSSNVEQNISIIRIIQKCTNEDPNERPTLNELENNINSLLNLYKVDNNAFFNVNMDKQQIKTNDINVNNDSNLYNNSNAQKTLNNIIPNTNIVNQHNDNTHIFRKRITKNNNISKRSIIDTNKIYTLSELRGFSVDDFISSIFITPNIINEEEKKN